MKKWKKQSTRQVKPNNAHTTKANPPLPSPKLEDWRGIVVAGDVIGMDVGVGGGSLATSTVGLLNVLALFDVEIGLWTGSIDCSCSHSFLREVSDMY